VPKLKSKNSYLNHLLRNQLTSLILYEKIETGLAKAKQLKPIAESLLTKAIQGDLNARRYVTKFLFDKKAVAKVFDLLVPKMKKKRSALVKIYRLGMKKGDGSQKALIMLGKDLQTVPEKKGSKTAPKKIKSKAKKPNDR
jgi:large subunit ribosomal protein L17